MAEVHRGDGGVDWSCLVPVASPEDPQSGIHPARQPRAGVPAGGLRDSPALVSMVLPGGNDHELLRRAGGGVRGVNGFLPGRAHTVGAAASVIGKGSSAFETRQYWQLLASGSGLEPVRSPVLGRLSGDTSVSSSNRPRRVRVATTPRRG